MDILLYADFCGYFAESASQRFETVGAFEVIDLSVLKRSVQSHLCLFLLV